MPHWNFMIDIIKSGRYRLKLSQIQKKLYDRILK